jgi:hypothetical protein
MVLHPLLTAILYHAIIETLRKCFLGSTPVSAGDCVDVLLPGSVAMFHRPLYYDHDGLRATESRLQGVR